MPLPVRKESIATLQCARADAGLYVAPLLHILWPSSLNDSRRTSVIETVRPNETSLTQTNEL